MNMLKNNLRRTLCWTLLAVVTLSGCAGGGVPVDPGTNAPVPSVTTENHIYEPSAPPADGIPALPADLPDLPDYQLTSDGRLGYYTDTPANQDGSYPVTKDFSMELFRRAYFNRYELSYSSSQPLRGRLGYLAWDASGNEVYCQEVFYLEKGQDMHFSSFTDGYLDGLYGFELTDLTLEPCRGARATFTLHAMTTVCREVISKEEYFMENDRFRVGILAAWGGGISYIEDKQDGDATLGNLINQCDTGRLIQQSYYGVGNGPDYTAAKYNGQLWNYNPVQGGDQYNNSSKLVDFSVSADGLSVYVKCRPLDWAQRNILTPSYMENTYTLKEDAILVSNRFVDFFGVTHPAAHAELPAFYVVSHLGVFHYYNGTKPWTGDAYESLPNEPFWAGTQSCYHTIVKGNTETWAAWTNTAGYGIGLYVPDTEILLAGRHAYDGSKDPLSGSTSYVAPLRTQTMVSFVPFEYDYVIAAGTVEQMRNTFAAYRETVS